MPALESGEPVWEAGRLYGMMAEFKEPAVFLAAIRSTRAAGYRRMDAYSPSPVDELSEAMGLGYTPVSLVVLVGGLFGAVLGYFLQYWAAALDFPLNVGGRPLNSWVSFIPITFELAVLCGSLAALLFGVLAMNGLPRPYHSVFNVPAFARASRDRYFVCIEATDAMFDPRDTRQFLESLDPLEVYDVED
jgi:hypothetical protein